VNESDQPRVDEHGHAIEIASTSNRANTPTHQRSRSSDMTTQQQTSSMPIVQYLAILADSVAQMQRVQDVIANIQVFDVSF
jgi:hypothetical protein